jgi:hypothetical protein
MITAYGSKIVWVDLNVSCIFVLVIAESNNKVFLEVFRLVMMS